MLNALTDEAEPRLPPGTLVVDRAGHDEIGSSEWIFGLTARALVGALSAALSGESAVEPVRAVLDRR